MSGVSSIALALALSRGNKDSWAATANVPSAYSVLNYALGVPINDGAPHPLTERFATLAAAKAVFPAATALTESLAWHALNRAVQVAANAKGGTVQLAYGRGVMSPSPGPIKLPLCIDGAATSQDTLNPSTNVQVNIVGYGDRISCLQWTAEVPGGYAIMCGQQAGDPVNQQTDSRYGPFAMSRGLLADFWMIGPARTLLNSNNLMGVPGCVTHGICWASRRTMRNVRVTWFNRGLDLVGDHTDFDGCQMTHNYDGFYINHPSPTMYGDWMWSGKFSSRLNRRSGVAVEYTASMGPCQLTGRPFIGTSPYGFYKVAPRAAGAMTNAAGYPVGATSIGLASAGVGAVVFGDFLSFAGDPTTYRVTVGDGDVSNAGSINFEPGLAQAIPAAATAVSINADSRFAPVSALLVNVQADSLFLESCGNAYFWDGRADTGGTPTAVLNNVQLTNLTLSSFSNVYMIPGRDRCIMNIGDAYGVDIGWSYEDIWGGLTLPAFNIQFLTGYLHLSGNIESWLKNTLASGKQPFGLGPLAPVNANRFRLQHNGVTADVGPWKGCFQCVPTGSNQVNEGHAVGFGPGGVYLISATSVTRPFAGLARTAAFPVNPPASGTTSFIAAAQESPGGIPYVGGGTFTANTMKKLQTGGALQDATDVTTDLRVIGFATSAGASPKTSIFPNAIGR